VRLGRVEIGKTVWVAKKIKEPFIALYKGSCGCIFLDLFFATFYITWLGNECYDIIKNKGENQ